MRNASILVLLMLLVPSAPGCDEAKTAAGAGIDVQLDAGRAASATALKAKVEQEIRAFHGAHARYPESLDELEADRDMRVPSLPLQGRWHYDPETGALTAVFGK